MPIVEFAYDNVKNMSTSYTYFELNYDFHPQISYE